MALKSAPYYWLECDKCEVKSTDGWEFSAWCEPQQAIDLADDSDWLLKDGKHLCESCRDD